MIKNNTTEQCLFEMHCNGEIVATLSQPIFEDMFWCSYFIVAINEKGDAIIHNEKTWELVDFVIKAKNGSILNTFSGGYQDFCNRKTDRLTFRSLWPQEPTLFERFLVVILGWSGYKPACYRNEN